MLIMFEAVSVCCGGLDKLDQFSDFNIVKYWGNHEEMLSAAACCDDVCPSGKKQLAVREGNGTPLQYSCLENPIDRGAAVRGVAEGRTRLSGFTFTFHFHALEKEMATHSSVLAWRIPGTVEPGGLPSMGSHRVGHD